MYINPNEISTHLGVEQIEAISDGDETMLLAAIDAAVVEAKSYLAAYNMASEMDKQGKARNSLLVTFIKDIAVWHFINICNVHTAIDLRQDRYERAVAWLKSVQKGQAVPDLEPKLSPAGEAENLPYKVSSNSKRSNHI